MLFIQENMNIVFDMKAKTTLCLNMIVKNESKVITRLLDSVCSIIDSYCICDTGSTDNTPMIIESYFKEKGIPGKVIYEPFKDFGYNRTFALQACENESNADFILLLDADMVFWLNPSITPSEFKESLTSDVYTIFQGGDTFYYKNTRIVRNNRGCKYWGVTHEYVQVPSGLTHGSIEKSRAFIIDIGDGGSKTNKFERDIQLLEQGLIDFPNNDRYTFYLANSYNDLGNYEKAIENYRKRIQLGGWHEEVWFSYFKIGLCYKYMGKMENAIYEWMQAYGVFPNRIENLYEIVKYYREKGQHKIAYVYYDLADKMRKKYPNIDYLFLQKDVYDYKLDYEFSIIAYYLDSHGKNVPKECMKICAHPSIEDSTLQNVMNNYKFYSRRYPSKQPKYCDILKNIANEYRPEGLTSTTPSLCRLENGDIALNIRYVNYTIDANGNYINKEVIQTINYLAILDTTEEEWTIKTIQEMDYNKIHDSLYAGLEDVRVFEYKNTLLYNANRGLGYHNMKIEHGKIDIQTCKTYEDVILKKEGERTVEKNWVLFESNEQLHCIYQWHPLTIGTIQDDIYNTIHEFSMPTFFKHVRGSTNGQLYDSNGEKELWFLCHTVSYENRRFYYHLFVCLDAITMKLKKYTPWFTFESKPVEYSLGFVFLEEDIVIGYSTMDNTTNFMAIEKSKIDEEMIRVD